MFGLPASESYKYQAYVQGMTVDLLFCRSRLGMRLRSSASL